MSGIKTNPLSLRLSENAIEAIRECEELSGLKRSAVVEYAIRKWRDELRRQSPKKSRKSKVSP